MYERDRTREGANPQNCMCGCLDESGVSVVFHSLRTDLPEDHVFFNEMVKSCVFVAPPIGQSGNTFARH